MDPLLVMLIVGLAAVYVLRAYFRVQKEQGSCTFGCKLQNRYLMLPVDLSQFLNLEE